jgi:effector-binding domain-containing protein
MGFFGACGPDVFSCEGGRMSYDVIVKEVPSRHLAGVRGTYRMVELPGVMGREFHRIMNALRAEGIEPSGGALSIYHGWTEETVDVEMAVPIRRRVLSPKPAW